MYFSLSSIVLFFFVTINAQPSAIYPVPWFTRTIYFTGMFDSAFCVNDGSIGARQNPNAHYGITQNCQIGQITSNNIDKSLILGNIGGSASSLITLGDDAAISRLLPAGTFYPQHASFSWYLGKNIALVYEKGVVVLNQTTIDPLLTTATGASYPVTDAYVGQVWIARITTQPGTTTELNLGTNVILMGVITELTTHAMHVEWGVLASVNPSQASSAFGGRQENWNKTNNVAITALIFSLFALIIGGFFLFTYFKTRTNYSPLLSESGRTSSL